MLNDVVRKRSTVFLFSDFLAKDYAPLLKIANKKHDVVGLVVEDPTERNFPTLGTSIELEDAETGETFSLKPRKAFGEKFQNVWVERKEKRDKIFSSVGMDAIEIETGKPYIDALVRFFKVRAKRFR